jgi:hypothetical protein
MRSCYSCAERAPLTLTAPATCRTSEASLSGRPSESALDRPCNAERARACDGASKALVPLGGWAWSPWFVQRIRCTLVEELDENGLAITASDPDGTQHTYLWPGDGAPPGEVVCEPSSCIGFNGTLDAPDEQSESHCDFAPYRPGLLASIERSGVIFSGPQQAATTRRYLTTR